jgi:hypothetical protein
MTSSAPRSQRIGDALRILLALAAAGAAFAIGDFLGGARSVDAGSPPVAATASPAPAGQGSSSQKARDAEARLWTLVQEPRSPWRTYRLFEAVSQLEAAQIPAALDSCRRMGGTLNQTLVTMLITRWHELDPGAAAQWAAPHYRRFLANGNFQDGLFSQAAYRWAVLDPERATQAAGKCESENRQLLIRIAWSEKITEATASGKLEELAALLNSNGQNAKFDELSKILGESQSEMDLVLTQFASAVSERHPDLALRLTRQVRNPHRRVWAFFSLLPDLAEHHPEQGLAALREELPHWTPSFATFSAVSEVYSNAAGDDRASALAAARELPDEWIQPVEDALLLHWADQEPLAALQWAHERGDALRPRVGFGLSALTTPPDWTSLAAKAMGDNSEATLAWIRSLPPGAERSGLLAQAFGEIPDQEMAAAYAELSPEWRAEFADHLIHDIPGDDPGRNVAALRQFPEGLTRLRAIEAYAAREFSADSPPITNRFPAGAERDAAILGTVKGMIRDTEAPHEGPLTAAAGLATQIADPAVRERALRRLGATWLARDETGGRAWLANASGLPPSVQAMLIRRHKER